MASKEKLKERYNKLKSLGLCVNCCEPSEDGKVLCMTCREKAYKAMNDKRNTFVKNKICRNCGKEPAESGSTRCLKCLKIQSDDNIKRRKRNNSSGLCRCGNKLADRSVYRCEHCLSKHKVYAKSKLIRRKENGLCIRCGLPLELSGRTNVTKCVNCMEIHNFNWN